MDLVSLHLAAFGRGFRLGDRHTSATSSWHKADCLVIPNPKPRSGGAFFFAGRSARQLARLHANPEHRELWEQQPVAFPHWPMPFEM
jgi:hypothetical protein